MRYKSLCRTKMRFPFQFRVSANRNLKMKGGLSIVPAAVFPKCPHTVISGRRSQVDFEFHKNCTRVSVSNRAFKLVSSLAIVVWFWLQFSLFNFTTVDHRRLLSNVIWVSQQLHCETDERDSILDQGFQTFSAL